MPLGSRYNWHRRASIYSALQVHENVTNIRSLYLMFSFHCEPSLQLELNTHIFYTRKLHKRSCKFNVSAAARQAQRGERSQNKMEISPGVRAACPETERRAALPSPER